MWDTKRIKEASGVARVKSNVVFPVRLANVSYRPVSFLARKLIGSSLPLPVAAGPHVAAEVEAGNPEYEGFFNPDELSH